jgi:hypothetical protein
MSIAVEKIVEIANSLSIDERAKFLDETVRNLLPPKITPDSYLLSEIKGALEILKMGEVKADAFERLMKNILALSLIED